MVVSYGCFIVISMSKGNGIETSIGNGCFILCVYTFRVIGEINIIWNIVCRELLGWKLGLGLCKFWNQTSCCVYWHFDTTHKTESCRDMVINQSSLNVNVPFDSLSKIEQTGSGIAIKTNE